MLLTTLDETSLENWKFRKAWERAYIYGCSLVLCISHFDLLKDSLESISHCKKISLKMSTPSMTNKQKRGPERWFLGRTEVSSK